MARRGWKSALLYIAVIYCFGFGFGLGILLGWRFTEQHGGSGKGANTTGSTLDVLSDFSISY